MEVIYSFPQVVSGTRVAITGVLKRSDNGPIMTGSEWTADFCGEYGSVTLTAEGDSLLVSLDRQGQSERITANFV